MQSRRAVESSPNQEILMSDSIDLRFLSIKCGNCNTYQTLAAFSRRDD